MSVIQDALKRRLSEQQQGRAAPGARPAGGAAPPPPPPIAEQVLRNDQAVRAADSYPEGTASPPISMSRHTDGGKWMFGTALILLFAVLVGGVLLYLKQGIPLVAVPPPTPAPGLPADAPSLPTRAAPSVADPVLSPAPPIDPERGADPAPPPRKDSAPPTDAVPRSDWPAIAVQGVMAGAEPKKRSAILNGQMVFLNQKIEDVRLVEVSADGVSLRYRGEEISLDIGQIANDIDEY